VNNLHKDIQTILDSKQPKDAAIYKIKLQPFYQTLSETCKELWIISISLKGDIDKLLEH